MKKYIKIVVFIFTLFLNINCLAVLDSAPKSVYGYHPDSFSGYESYAIREKECKKSSCNTKGRFFAIKKVNINNTPYLAYCSGTIKQDSPGGQTSSSIVGEADNVLALILQNGYPNKTFTSNWKNDYYITQSAVWLYLDQKTNWGSRYNAENWKKIDSGSPEDYTRYYVYWLVENAKQANKNGEKAVYKYYIYSFKNRQNLLVTEPVGRPIETQEQCTENSPGASGATNRLTDVCTQEDTSFNDRLTSTCQIKKNDYYNRVCDETVGVSANPDISTLERSIDYSVSYKGMAKCTFNFDASKWNEDYDKWVAETDKPDCDDRCKASVQANLNTLNQMVDQYENMVKNTRYDFSPDAYIDNKTKSFTTVKDNNTTNNNNVIKNLVQVSCSTLKNSRQVCNYKFRDEDSLISSGTMNLDRVIKLPDNGKVKFNLFVENLGSHGLWKVEGPCDKTIHIPVTNYFYREIDPADPFDFRSNANVCTDAGDNWCNGNYDYVDTIPKEIPENDYLYSFSITRENVQSIKTLNKLEKDSQNGYNGTDCEEDNKGNLKCAFLRNRNYFKIIKIKGE